MFNKEEFIAKYIEVLKDSDSKEVELMEVTATLPQDQDSQFYLGMIQELIFALKKEDEDFSEEIRRLDNTHQLMVFMEELTEKDSNTEVAKEVAETGQTTEDVETDSVADEDAEVAVDATEAESEGKAPAEEVKAEKSEKV